MTALCRSLLTTGVLVSLSLGILVARQAAPVVASARVDLTDPAGDVQPIIYRESVGSGPERDVKYPAFDVVKLSVSSDGSVLTLAATLTAPPAKAAYEVLEFYVDADNNRKTGITHPDNAKLLAGVEYYGTLEDCLEHQLFGTMCAGTDNGPVKHSAIVTLEKFGKEWMFKDALLDFPASGTVKEPRKAPVVGPIIQATVPYAAMGLKPGQTIRLVLREVCAGKTNGVTQGYFPEVVLTLK